MSRSIVRRRLAAWWRWMTRPWRSVGLIVALVASFALPTFMAASMDLFLTTASNSITRQVLADHPTGLDVTVVATGRLGAGAVADLDEQVRGQLDLVGRLAVPERTMHAELALQSPPTADGEAAQTIIGSGARFVARDGAVEALDVVEGDRSVDGVWISERLAGRLELTAGSLVVVNDGEPVRIAGVFTNLWEGDRDPYWDRVPPALVPPYSAVFRGPLFETVVVSESLFDRFAVDGVVRWDTEATELPDTFDELVAQDRRTRRLERSFTESSEMVSAIDAFSGPGGAVPAVVSDVFDLRFDVDAIIAEIEQPIATTAVGGIILGLIVTAAGAAFAVGKRAAEVRLLRADGDAAWRFAARALMQYLPPAVVGAAIGLASAWLLLSLPGESERSPFDVIDLGRIVWTVVVGLVIASAVTAMTASRVSRTRSGGASMLRAVWFPLVVGVAVAAWVQVGSAGDADEVDWLVVAFPLVGLIAGVGLVVGAAHWVMRRAHRTGGSLPSALFLAWRRITAADAAAVLLSAAMGVSLGLIVFSTSLVASLDSAIEAKATTAVGGETQSRVARGFDEPLPDRTTVIHELRTRLTIGREPVTVLAIDPATYEAGVSWHPSFGSSAAGVVDLLGTAVDADVAAVGVDGIAVPAEGGIGTSSVLAYEVVESLDAVPLASEVFPTLVVSADQVAAAARRDHDARRPPGVDPDDWGDEFRSPLFQARPVLVSQLDEERLTAFLEASDVTYDEVVSRADREDLVENRAARWTFAYLGLLAVIAGLAAVGTLFFYLSEQRANRQLSSVMTQRMGLRRGAAAGAAVGEVAGLVALAFVAGASTGLVLATRVFDRFEPDPRLVPDVGLTPPWLLVAAMAVAALTVVVVAALANQWVAGRRSYAEVLRGT